MEPKAKRRKTLKLKLSHIDELLAMKKKMMDPLVNHFHHEQLPAILQDRMEAWPRWVVELHQRLHLSDKSHEVRYTPASLSELCLVTWVYLTECRIIPYREPLRASLQRAITRGACPTVMAKRGCDAYKLYFRGPQSTGRLIYDVLIQDIPSLPPLSAALQVEAVPIPPAPVAEARFPAVRESPLADHFSLSRPLRVKVRQLTRNLRLVTQRVDALETTMATLQRLLNERTILTTDEAVVAQRAFEAETVQDSGKKADDQTDADNPVEARWIGVSRNTAPPDAAPPAAVKSTQPTVPPVYPAITSPRETDSPTDRNSRASQLRLEALDAQSSGIHIQLVGVLQELLGFSPEFLSQPWNDFMPTWGIFATAQDMHLKVEHAIHELLIFEGCFLEDLHCQSLIEDSSVTPPLLLRVVSYKLSFLIAPERTLSLLEFLAFIEESPRISSARNCTGDL